MPTKAAVISFTSARVTWAGEIYSLDQETFATLIRIKQEMNLGLTEMVNRYNRHGWASGATGYKKARKELEGRIALVDGELKSRWNADKKLEIVK